MIGHGFGPGGKLSFLLRRNLERNKRNRVARNTAVAVQVVPSIVLIGRWMRSDSDCVMVNCGLTKAVFIVIERWSLLPE